MMHRTIVLACGGLFLLCSCSSNPPGGNTASPTPAATPNILPQPTGSPPAGSSGTTQQAPHSQPGAAVNGNDESDPERVLREFLVASLLGDEATIKALMVPHADASLLWEGREPAPPEAAAMAKQSVEQIPLRRLQIGETIQIPGAGPVVIDQNHVNDNRVEFATAESPIPFIVVRAGKSWKVDASPIIAARKAVKRLTEQQKK